MEKNKRKLPHACNDDWIKARFTHRPYLESIHRNVILAHVMGVASQNDSQNCFLLKLVFLPKLPNPRNIYPTK